MDDRRYNELVVFLVRQTGWTLEYITGLPLGKLTTLARELNYQHETELHRLGSYSAMVAVMLAKKGTRITDFIGQAPRRLTEGREYNLVKKSELETITLGDGKAYELAPLNLNILVDIEDKFNKPLSEVMKDGSIKVARFIIWRRLQAKYPELTEEKVGEMLDINAINSLSKALKI